jgi:hypothetical protein
MEFESASFRPLLKGKMLQPLLHQVTQQNGRGASDFGGMRGNKKAPPFARGRPTRPMA